MNVVMDLRAGENLSDTGWLLVLFLHSTGHRVWSGALSTWPEASRCLCEHPQDMNRILGFLCCLAILDCKPKVQGALVHFALGTSFKYSPPFH
jgi:hypothetical protein